MWLFGGVRNISIYEDTLLPFDWTSVTGYHQILCGSYFLLLLPEIIPSDHSVSTHVQWCKINLYQKIVPVFAGLSTNSHCQDQSDLALLTYSVLFPPSFTACHRHLSFWTSNLPSLITSSLLYKLFFQFEMELTSSLSLGKISKNSSCRYCWWF